MLRWIDVHADVVSSFIQCFCLFSFGGKETAPPPEQRYRPRPVRAGVYPMLVITPSMRVLVVLHVFYMSCKCWCC